MALLASPEAASSLNPAARLEVLINAEGALAYVIRGWLPPSHASPELFTALHEGLPWSQGKISMYGREVTEARPVAVVGEGGRTIEYSRIKRPHADWALPTAAGGLADRPGVALLRDLCPYLQVYAGHPVNSCLLNYYRTSSEYLSQHIDQPTNQRGWLSVVTLSLGGGRLFRFSRQDDPKIHLDTWLQNGDLMLMNGGVQKVWRHGIPKVANADIPRISLTYRYVE